MQMRREALAEMPPLPFKGRRLCIHDSGCFSANPVHQGRKQRPSFLISLSLNLIRITHAFCSMPAASGLPIQENCPVRRPEALCECTIRIVC